jgi:class 3 adenylate cyclase
MQWGAAMDYDALLSQVIELLQREKRVPYRALKRRFDIDDDYIEDLKIDIIEAKQLAVDENDRILVWIGESGTTPQPTAPSTQIEQQSVSQETQPISVEPPPSESRPREAERRQLTVMFCDLVDSTKLSSKLDPEDYREVVREYQQVCSKVIQRYDGHIAQLLGDGLLVYFGYPVAHEEDAQRAIHTGLGIIEAIGALNTRLEQTKRIRLALRLGIHTGLVVVGEMGGVGRQELLALGETPNIAARIQGLAAPDSGVISDATYRLVQGYFEFDEDFSVLAEALALVEKTEVRFYESELYRLKGELLIQQSSDNAAEAESCFQKAITSPKTKALNLGNCVLLPVSLVSGKAKVSETKRVRYLSRYTHGLLRGLIRLT